MSIFNVKPLICEDGVKALGQLKRSLVVVFFIWFPGLGMTQNIDNNEQLNEFWYEVYLNKKISNRHSMFLLLNSLHRCGEGNYDNFAEIGVNTSLSEYFYLEIFFRHERYREESNWLVENRPQIRFGSKFKLGNWSFRNRQRLEYRMLPKSIKKIRYRTDFRLIPPKTIVFKGVRPFYATEFFISKGELDRIRNYLGIFFDGISPVVPWLYILHQGDLDSNTWRPTYILGGMVLVNL